MLSVQLTFNAYHLGLDPDAEVHAEIIDFFRQSLKTLRQLFEIRFPVAESLCVVFAVAEPAVVQNKQLDSKLLARNCRFGEGYQTFFGNIEVARFPAVEQDGTRLKLPFAADDVPADKTVHIFALSGKSPRGISHHRFGSLKALVFVQDKPEAAGLDSRDDSCFSVGVNLDGGVVVAAVNQVKAVYAARKLACFGSMNHKERIGAVRGTARARFDDKLARVDRRGAFIHLPCPRAVEGRDAYAAERNSDLCA